MGRDMTHTADPDRPHPSDTGSESLDQHLANPACPGDLGDPTDLTDPAAPADPVDPADPADPADRFWFAVTADVIRSRRLTPRAQAQQHIQTALERFNALLKPASKVAMGAVSSLAGCLASSFTLGRGDELQGVLVADAPLMAVLRHLRGLLQPIQIRIGVGLGTIVTPVDPEDSWQMDGPAFRQSRQALERLGHTTLPQTFMMVEGATETRPGREAVSSQASRLQDRVNVLLALTDELMRRWTAAQWEAIDTLERNPTYRAAAQVLGITSQNVHKRVRAAGWPAVAQAEELANREIRLFLDDRGGRGERDGRSRSVEPSQPPVSLGERF